MVTEMSAISICLAAVSIAVAAVLYLRSRTKRCNIPGPKGWPLVGLYPTLRHEVFKDFAELSKKYGDIFCCRFGTADVVVINKYEIIDELFRKRQGTFNDRFIKLPEDLIFQSDSVNCSMVTNGKNFDHSPSAS